MKGETRLENVTVAQLDGLDDSNYPLHVHGEEIRNISVEKHSPFAREVMHRVCIAQNIKKFTTTSKFRFFQPLRFFLQQAMSDDFGPFNLESIASFCKLLDHELSSFQRLKIVFCVPHGQRALSIAVFLLGSHMILHSALTADETASRFRWLPLPSLSLDGPLADTKSGLTLPDYWRGLEQGRAAGWVGTASGRGGALDLERNAHYGDPLNGDVQ